MNHIRKLGCTFQSLLALMVSFSATPSVIAADGDCLQWDVSGIWHITQANGTQVLMKLQQNGTQLQGQASYSHYNNDTQKVDTISGPIDGSIGDGRYIHATVNWSNSTAGYYRGTVGSDGLINGFTHEVADYENNANFRASGYPHCLMLATNTPPPPPAAPAVPASTQSATALKTDHSAITTQGQPATVKAQGRVKLDGAPATSHLTICEAAVAARARNSPAAPGLEAQCAAQAANPALPVIDEAWREQKAARGEQLALQDPMARGLRNQWQDPIKIRAFNIGLAVAEGQTALGPGKQAIQDALAENEQRPFQIAVWYSIDRNANADLAAAGAAIAANDPSVAAARSARSDPFYWLGFDIATGIFGDPALGARGNTAIGPGSMKIRDALNPDSAREGFNAAVELHLDPP